MRPRGSKLIPVTAHISPTVLQVGVDGFLTFFRIKGINYSLMSPARVEENERNIHNFLIGLSREGLRLYNHTIRDRVSLKHVDSGHSFADLVAKNYEEALSDDGLFVNDSIFTLFLSSVSLGGGGRAEAIRRLENLSTYVLSSLSEHHVTQLGCRYNDRGVFVSEPLTFLSNLINGECDDFPYCPNRIGDHLQLSEIQVVKDGETYIKRLKRDGSVEYLSGFVFQKLPEESRPGMFILFRQFSGRLILSSSTHFYPDIEAVSMLKNAYKIYKQSHEVGLDALKQGIEDNISDVNTGQLSIVDNQFAVFVVADSLDQLREMSGHFKSEAQRTGGIVDRVRKPSHLIMLFRSFIPGNWFSRICWHNVTTMNLANFDGFEGESTGPLRPFWGAPLGYLVNADGSPYGFSFHPPGSHLGHTLAIAPSRSGKSVFLSWLILMLERMNSRTFVFDLRRGSQAVVEALGGTVLEPHTGCLGNPFSADVPPEKFDSYVEFLEEFVLSCVNAGHASPIGGDDVLRTRQYVRDLMYNFEDRSVRSFKALIAQVNPTQKDGLFLRLWEWAEGKYSHFFKSGEDTFDLDGSLYYLDMTNYIEKSYADPILSYLLKRLDMMRGMGRMVIMFEELPQALKHPLLSRFIERITTQWAGDDVVFVGVVQTIGQIQQSAIATSVIGSIATKVWFPNPNAQLRDHEIFGMGGHLFQTVRELPARHIIVQQGDRETLLRFDLSLVPQLPLMGMNEERLAIFEQAKADAGSDNPRIWVPLFFEKMEDLS